MSFLACPRCQQRLEQPGQCQAEGCGGEVREVDGWYLEASDSESLSTDQRKRVDVYDKPFAARLYDVDIRATSALIWGAPLAEQVEFNRRALKLAVERETPYLDIPVGTGLVLSRALELSSRVPELIVVDLSLAMLARARRRLGDAATYVRASVESLPLSSGCVGSLHTANGLHLFPSTESACAELARVLEPGGSLFATTWTNDGNRLARGYQRVFRQMGYINDPAPASHYLSALTAVGLSPDFIEQRGSFLMSRGHLRSGQLP